MKTALITGGSRGIGAACAHLLADRGYQLAINYVSNKEAAEAVAAECEKRGATKTVVVQGDVGSEADILRIFEESDAALGPLTAFINNAGVVDQKQNVADMSYDRLERMMRINVIGSIFCAREAIRRMAFSHGGKGGAIVNVSSAAARLGSANQYVDYASSKGAIDTFTKGLSMEMANEGIRVNGIRPGVIDTDLHASGGLPNRVKDLEETIPMKRGGSAQEVAEAIVFLLSDEASYITGTTIDVTGGR